MTEPGLPTRRGAHRAPESPWRGLLSLLFLLLTVTAVLVAVVVWLRPAPSEGAGPLDGVDTSTPTPSVSPTASPTVSPTPTPTPTPTATPLRRTARVLVLNGTTRTGFAATVAKDLAKLGWRTDTPTNFTGTLAHTTIFYPAGMLAQAQLLSRDLPITVRLSLIRTGMSATELTLVLESDYPAA